MPLGFATLPLGPTELRALADSGYSIIDQGARTPGLLIVQAPDEQRGPHASGEGDGRGASEGGEGSSEAAQSQSGADGHGDAD